MSINLIPNFAYLFKKLTIKDDNLRDVEVYVDKKTGLIKELKKDTKLILGKKNTNGRYYVLVIEKEDVKTTAPYNKHTIVTISENAVKKIDRVLNYPKDYYKQINKNTPINTINFPKEKIEIKAGEVIGLIGEYNRNTKEKNEQLHLEVFTKDDVKTFAKKAKEHYKTDTNKPKPIKLKIPKDIKEYKKEKILIIASSAGYTNLRKAYTNTQVGYKTIKVLNSDIKIQIDESTLNSNRYLVTKIEEANVKEQNWTVHKNYIKESFEYKETNTTQLEDKIVKINEIKKQKDKENKEYIEIEEKYFLYSDCEELHPITFHWAKIFDVESNDKISIFENLQEVLNPSFYDKYLGSSDEGLKLNPKFQELFDAIESDDNDEIIDPQELEEAVTDITIKKLTSKYIVKHPSEWKYEKDKWGSIEEILEKEEDKKHFENENKRIEKLQLFDDCKKAKIPDFPQSDEVYHINPIGLVGEFKVNANFDWSKTPIVKLIISKESKGSYSAYNITGWNTAGRNKVYESHFEATSKYNLETMTINEIQKAQITYEGVNRKHLFAVGLYQLIPKTLSPSITWLKTKKTFDISSQKFDKEFQDLLPLYFWEKKRPLIGSYFKGKVTSTEAAYSISKEWASAGTPKGYKIANTTISDGTQSYYGGDGLNSAHYSSIKTIKALEETKKMIDNYGGYETILKNSFKN